MVGGAWWAAVHGITKRRTGLSNFTFTFHFHALKKEMATHSSVLAWRIPGTGEPGGLPEARLKRLSSSSSSRGRWLRVFMGKRGDVNAVLYKLFTKNLGCRVKLFCTYDWVIECMHFFFVTRKRYIFFSAGNLQVSALFFSFGNSATIQQFDLECSAKV